MSLTNAVTNQQIDSLLQALDHEPVMDCDYAVVRRWLEMINSAAEPRARRIVARHLDWCKWRSSGVCNCGARAQVESSQLNRGEKQ